jgi:2-hydroxychromene-2-carboxylate isomerase
MLEPENNPNPSFMVDPPRPMRFLISRMMSRNASAANISKKRKVFEAERQAKGAPHVVEYFHQLDDPYSHLSAQILSKFATRYDVEIAPHLIRATGGKDQPELEKLAVWARRDAGLIAPHLGLMFPEIAGDAPDGAMLDLAGRSLAGKSAKDFVASLSDVSAALWQGTLSPSEDLASEAETTKALDEGSARLIDLKHYSGAMFFYGGEFYWGVDRLFHLEQRLSDLGLRRDGSEGFLAPRPQIDVSGIDASALTLHFYPSLNSPYTAIIYDRTLEMVKACNIVLAHKPVLPMIMRGVPATRAKGGYILFDAKREADWAGVPFGPITTPLGDPTRNAYSLMGWAREQGKDTQLLSSLLRNAFSKACPLHKTRGMRLAVEEAGLAWSEAAKIMGDPAWKDETERFQDEMVEDMGLWGVPSYRISGGDDEDFAVWGQDRLWLIAAEIRRRAGR